MKKIVLSIVITLATMSTFAQNNKNNITVNGVYNYDITPEYSSKMIVSLTNVYYDVQAVTMAEVKSGYLAKLAKIGINSDRLEEDKLHYALMGYEKEGTIFVFKTKSLEEMQKFLSVKALGVSRSDTTLETQLTQEQISDYSKAAFDNAKSKAMAIASKLGRKIGKAIYISDTNPSKISESMYYGNTKEKRDYYISVSFELD
jgi:uncharacterized protein YggE